MIGIDIIELERVKSDDTFLKKIAFDEEIEYIKKGKSLRVQKQKIAALWCVKEAVMKALGLGEKSGVKCKDIQLFHEESGKPYVKVYGVALKALGKRKIEVSISHSKTIVTAIAIII